MKAIELSGLHIGKWVKVTFKLNRRGAKQHEWYVWVTGVQHKPNGDVLLHEPSATAYHQRNWYQDNSTFRHIIKPNMARYRATYGVDNHPVLPYYADVEVLDFDNNPSA